MHSDGQQLRTHQFSEDGPVSLQLRNEYGRGPVDVCTVVSMRHDRVVSLTGEIIFTNGGLKYCVADSKDACIAKMPALAIDLPRLTEPGIPF